MKKSCAARQGTFHRSDRTLLPKPTVSSLPKTMIQLQSSKGPRQATWHYKSILMFVRHFVSMTNPNLQFNTVLMIAELQSVTAWACRRGFCLCALGWALSLGTRAQEDASVHLRAKFKRRRKGHMKYRVPLWIISCLDLESVALNFPS